VAECEGGVPRTENNGAFKSGGHPRRAGVVNMRESPAPASELTAAARPGGLENAMHSPVKPNVTLTYAASLYDRALKPDQFRVKLDRVVRAEGCILEGWLCPGSHALKVERPGLSACEVVHSDMDRHMPTGGLLSSFVASGEHEFEHTFAAAKVNYYLSIQTETLTDQLYEEVFEEISDLAKENKALTLPWEDDAGRCLSVLDFTRRPAEVAVDSYHLVAAAGIVVRAASIFEFK